MTLLGLPQPLLPDLEAPVAAENLRQETRLRPQPCRLGVFAEPLDSREIGLTPGRDGSRAEDQDRRVPRPLDLTQGKRQTRRPRISDQDGGIIALPRPCQRLRLRGGGYQNIVGPLERFAERAQPLRPGFNQKKFDFIVDNHRIPLRPVSNLGRPLAHPDCSDNRAPKPRIPRARKRRQSDKLETIGRIPRKPAKTGYSNGESRRLRPSRNRMPIPSRSSASRSRGWLRLRIASKLRTRLAAKTRS